MPFNRITRTRLLACKLSLGSWCHVAVRRDKYTPYALPLFLTNQYSRCTLSRPLAGKCPCRTRPIPFCFPEMGGCDCAWKLALCPPTQHVFTLLSLNYFLIISHGKFITLLISFRPYNYSLMFCIILFFPCLFRCHHYGASGSYMWHACHWSTREPYKSSGFWNEVHLDSDARSGIKYLFG